MLLLIANSSIITVQEQRAITKEKEKSSKLIKVPHDTLFALLNKHVYHPYYQPINH